MSRSAPWFNNEIITAADFLCGKNKQTEKAPVKSMIPVKSMAGARTCTQTHTHAKRHTPE